jgi:hypothetical protein
MRWPSGRLTPAASLGHQRLPFGAYLAASRAASAAFAAGLSRPIGVQALSPYGFAGLTYFRVDQFNGRITWMLTSNVIRHLSSLVPTERISVLIVHCALQRILGCP